MKFVFEPLKAKIIKQRKVMNQHEVEAAALNRIISMLSRDSRVENDVLSGTTAPLALIFQLASFWYSLVRSVL